MAYNHLEIEAKWQRYWEKNSTFKTEDRSAKPKYYVLDMFPYPSAKGLHVGHPEGYTATDILARYKRARGFNVLHPMGWDAFGLPAEQYAIETGQHPSAVTDNAMLTFKRQLSSLAFSFDWSREISTCSPKYYKWTQHIFTKLFERGLAYQKEVPVNWCPGLKTVLANEEVVDGKSERGAHPVFRIPMKQWMLKITAYAERLLKDLDKLDWPESTKELQRNWIGKSEGAQVTFKVDGQSAALEIFTTRPDTLWGATYMVLAPEHSLVDSFTTAAQKSQVDTYRKIASQKSEIARQEQDREKTGVFTGAYAINPVNDEKIPIWIADYVMMGYGTGAIMAVPAHDERDYAFAKAFDLPIREVVQKPEGFEGCFSGEGVAINSGFLNGKLTLDAKKAITEWCEKEKVGRGTVNYRLRDWLFSRQRYWGEPFPVLHLEDGSLETLKLGELPVVLPDVKSYEPVGSGESPLAGIQEWLWTTDSKGRKARRETDTMPGSAGSSWYFLRYCDPHNENEAYSAEAAKYWMPVDLYIGGPEHAVGHLLYARFWTKVLFDCGLCPVDEPFKKLVHQGMIQGPDGEKMSKSRGNVINPDDVIRDYGADTLRVYEMFMGPLERDKPWSTTAIEGTFRFLQRAWRVVVDDAGQLKVNADRATDEDLKVLHKTIKKVTDDIESLRFNTAISQMMIFVNHFTKENRAPAACLRAFTQLLQPFAPHIAEEFWERMGEKSSLSYTPWPEFDAALAKDDTLKVAVQILGKLRGTLDVAADCSQEKAVEMARANPTINAYLDGKEIKKIVYVPGKILNFVV